jgi:hypothetical protein
LAALAEAREQAPVVFEWFGNYDYLQQRDWSFDAAVHFMLRIHVTLINDNIGRVPPEAVPGPPGTRATRRCAPVSP